MIKSLIFCTGLFLIAESLAAQSKPLTYYLPDISYDPQIPTPEQFLGYQVGDRHVSHDQLRFYMQELARLSGRISIEEYARSYGGRPLQLLTVTSPANHARIDEILEQRRILTDPRLPMPFRPEEVPLVIYQGYSVHGNESSGSNAALLIAYYLAAGRSAGIEQLLDAVVVLIDPCLNPDGLHRFSTWVNMHRNHVLTGDPADREFNEPWPRARTNHYWFDLNRDWLPLQHPESRGRVAAFHRWKPNVLTDHHEMGTHATYFFMPGVPSRTHPVTPWRNQELTAEIATYHAEALDAIGSLYYAREGFDDFYYGKGSTYPDGYGCIGILFEQASSRGHLQESVNGLLDFPFTIRNQVATSLSTQRAAVGLKGDLAEFHHHFFKSAIEEAKQDPVKAWVYGDDTDPARLAHFTGVLLQHGIEVYALAEGESIGTFTGDGSRAFVVPTEQPNYRMIRVIFERLTSFTDSIFYDVSSWTLPLAFGLAHQEIRGTAFRRDLLGARVLSAPQTEGAVHGAHGEYGYLLPWDGTFAPEALYRLQDAGLRVRVAHQPFTLPVVGMPMAFGRGTVFIPRHNQDMHADSVSALVNALAGEGHVFYRTGTGDAPDGIDMGSPRMAVLEKPAVMLVTGDGANSYGAGEVWHLLDQRYGIPVSKVDGAAIARVNLDRYNTIIMADGSFGAVGNSGADKLRDWVSGGGVLILIQGAVQWAAGQKLVDAKTRVPDDRDQPGRRPYDQVAADRGRDVIGGAIFETTVDLTHPLLYGYRDEKLAVFRRGTHFYEPASNAYATPVRYTPDPLLAGYISAERLESLRGSASVFVGGIGRGRVICFADNPVFRAHWWGTQKLLANAIFFGRTISGQTVEAAPGRG